MLKVDIGKALPITAVRYLIALIPGFFFLICVGMGNPCLVERLAARLPLITWLGKPTILCVPIFLAFVIGATFMNLVGVIRYILKWLYLPWLALKGIYRERALLPVLNYLLTTPLPQPNSPPAKPKPRWLLNLRARTIQQIYSPLASEASSFRWWVALATQLLRTRYGLKEEDFPPPRISWQPLRQVLATPTREELYGHPMNLVLEATGWGALAALYFAPGLHERWFYLFAVFLIATGILHDLTLTSFLMNPDAGDVLRLRAILREFPKQEAQKTPEAPAEIDAPS
jgi:hypothetical protein